MPTPTPAATQVTLSDGARPLPNQPVIVKRGDSTSAATTDAFGRLPPMTPQGSAEQVSLIVDEEGTQETIAEFSLQPDTKSFVVVRLDEEYKNTLAPHNPQPDNKPQPREPIRYVAEPGDSFAKLAKLFEIPGSQIESDNPNVVRYGDNIFPGQVLSIYAKNPEAGAEPAAPPATTLPHSEPPNAGTMPDQTAADSQHPAFTSISSQTLRDINASRAIRSDENKGHPLALVYLKQKRAPWMEVAVAQYKLWGGADESVIDDTINYHKEIGLGGFKDMTGNERPWCASFVNFCIKSAGYAHSGSPGSQSFLSSKNFYEIEKPVYGALVVYTKITDTAKGHVALAYCKIKGGDIAILGGNQGDTLSLHSLDGYLEPNPRTKKSTFKVGCYFVPIAYKEYADKQLAAGGDLGPEVGTLASAEAAFGHSAKATKNSNTR